MATPKKTKTVQISPEVWEFLCELCPEPRLISTDEFHHLAYAMGRRSVILDLAQFRAKDHSPGTPITVPIPEEGEVAPRDWLEELALKHGRNLPL